MLTLDVANPQRFRNADYMRNLLRIQKAVDKVLNTLEDQILLGNSSTVVTLDDEGDVEGVNWTVIDMSLQARGFITDRLQGRDRLVKFEEIN